jgi:hypothetical protein
MGIHEAVWDGPGYFLGRSLTRLELEAVRWMITAQFLDHLRAIDPNLADKAAQLGIENYHLLQHSLDHGAVWTKRVRIWSADLVPALKRMSFYRAVVEEFEDVVTSDNELLWRLVRPERPEDVGPIHADAWFWDLGDGQPPPGYGRFKVWIPVFAEPGYNGLCVVPYSHQRDWKYHGEARHGITKPVLDEKLEDLDLQLLPLAPGEMVFFHDRLLHGGVVNRGTRCRVSVELTLFFRKDFTALRSRAA